MTRLRAAAAVLLLLAAANLAGCRHVDPCRHVTTRPNPACATTTPTPSP